LRGRVAVTWLRRDRRELANLGITDLAQLEKPIPEGIVVKLRMSLRNRKTPFPGPLAARFEVLRE
jgi:hypothetical protein